METSLNSLILQGSTLPHTLLGGLTLVKNCATTLIAKATIIIVVSLFHAARTNRLLAMLFFPVSALAVVPRAILLTHLVTQIVIIVICAQGICVTTGEGVC